MCRYTCSATEQFKTCWGLRKHKHFLDSSCRDKQIFHDKLGHPVYFYFLSCISYQQPVNHLSKGQPEYNLPDPLQLISSHRAVYPAAFFFLCKTFVYCFYSGGDLPVGCIWCKAHSGIQAHGNLLVKRNNFLFSEINHSGVYGEKWLEASLSHQFILPVSPEQTL